MLVLKTIRWKNFLSTGDVFTEVKLEISPNVLFIGENGAGKSTILDALMFSLFDKPFRKISKGKLVNSVNAKNCVVEIEFETNNKKYKVVRGIKPNIFQIFCDGVLLNQDSATRDYQQYLETFILGMNRKSFTQIVILGSANFVPFMQLAASERREVIEDLLDIKVFSVMSALVKQRSQNNKHSFEQTNIETAGKTDKKAFVERTIASLKKNNEERADYLREQITLYEKEIGELETQIETLRGEQSGLDTMSSKMSKLNLTLNALGALKAKISTKLDSCVEDLKFYEKHDNCPKCRQSIDKNFKDAHKKSVEIKSLEYETALKELVDKMSECRSEIDVCEKGVVVYNDLCNKITSKKTKVVSLRAMIDETQKTLSTLTASDQLLTDNETELSLVVDEIKTLEAQRKTLIEEKSYIDVASELLKDGGIKTVIVKKYLPVINSTINTYLMQMGFLVDFNLDENFDESIKSRYHDDFSYQNFSQGEKFRIDLSLLLAWRAIARMKNSTNTNILIFDEIFDGSLDSTGTDEFLKIMDGLKNDTNVFVISHKQDQMIDKFDKVYKFEKRHNFSTMKVV